MKELMAQIFGIGAMIFLFSLYQQKTRKKLIIAKLGADVCWVIHYLLLGGTAGMIPNFLGIFRELIFIQRENKKWANKIIIPIFFILCGWLMGAYTFKTWFNILPIAASAFVTISLWVKNPKLTKLISIPVSLSFLVYDCFVGSYIGIINEGLSICSIFISFIREVINKKTERNP